MHFQKKINEFKYVYLITSCILTTIKYLYKLIKLQ